MNSKVTHIGRSWTRCSVPAVVASPGFGPGEIGALIPRSMSPIPTRSPKKKGSSPICVKQKAGARAPLLPWGYQASRRQEGDRGPGASYYPAGRLGGI